MDVQIQKTSGAEAAGGVSGSTLKWIALITMLIDHTAATVLARELWYTDHLLAGGHYAQWQMVYVCMRIIGRMAFPIYCFLLVEGFLHTHSVGKYAWRLFLFALISEIPFDLAFNMTWQDMSYNNVFFTLFCGLAVIAGIRWLNGRFCPKSDSGWKKYAYLLARLIAIMTVVFAGMLVAEDVLCTDYGAGGVAAITVLYLLRNCRLLSYAAAVLILAAMSGRLELAALLMLIPLAFYNGKRGRQMKYVFYAFYPLHLLVLVGICWLLGLPC